MADRVDRQEQHVAQRAGRADDQQGPDAQRIRDHQNQQHEEKKDLPAAREEASGDVIVPEGMRLPEEIPDVPLVFPIPGRV